MLTSAARDALTGVETVILDEVHAVAGTKRGAHLALSLERLDELLPRPARRIGLSATVRPVDEVARYLSPQRKVEIVQPPSGKEFDLSVVVPGGGPGRAGRLPGRRRLRKARRSPRSGRMSRSGSPTWSRPTARRSSSPTPAASPSACATGSTRSPTSGPPASPWPSTTPPRELMGGSGAAQGAPAVLARAHHGSVSKEQRALRSRRT